MNKQTIKRKKEYEDSLGKEIKFQPLKERKSN
jgi:hypothetical protein